MSKIYNKSSLIIGIVIMLVINAIFIASLISTIYICNLEGFDVLSFILTIVAFISDIIIIFYVLKKCFIRITIKEDNVIFSNLFGGVSIISKDNVSKIYLENMQDTPIYICIETKDGLFTSDNPFKIKYHKKYANEIKEALKND